MVIEQDNDQLREDLALYHTIFDTMEEGVIVQDAQGHIVMCNPAAKSILGLTADQMRGRSTIHPAWPIVREDGSPFPSEMHPVVCALRTGEPQSNVMMGLQKPDGAQLWVAVNCQPLYNTGDAHLYGVVSTFSDVTERQEAEKRIRWLARFPAENLHPVLRVAPNGAIIYANASSTALLNAWGVEPEQMLPEIARAKVTASLENEASQAMEVSIGSQVLALTFSPDVDSRYVNIYGLDITTRKQAEKALQDSEKTTRMLLEAAPIGIVVVDETGRIVMVNKSATELFGYAQEALINQPLEVLVPENARSLHARHRAGYVSNPRTRPMGNGLNLTGRHGDGHVFPVEISLGYVRTKQGLLTVAFIVDMTRQRELEQLREAMIHTMVHDLRNPLGAIYTGLAFLKEDATETLGDHHRYILNVAARNSERMLTLITSILDVSQLESGQLPVHQTAFQLPKLALDVLASMAALVEKKGLHIRNDMPATLPDVLADEQLIGRVFQNLIGNAIKFTPDGGTISTTARVENDKLRIAISDTGPGIPPELRPRLFQKFVTGKHREHGHGLGLAFCKLAIEAHGEHLDVQSEPGQGTTFVFTLPVAP